MRWYEFSGFKSILKIIPLSNHNTGSWLSWLLGGLREARIHGSRATSPVPLTKLEITTIIESFLWNWSGTWRPVKPGHCLPYRAPAAAVSGLILRLFFSPALSSLSLSPQVLTCAHSPMLKQFSLNFLPPSFWSTQMLKNLYLFIYLLSALHPLASQNCHLESHPLWLSVLSA